MSQEWRKIGIISGGGDLPLRLANECKQSEIPYFLIRLKGYADESLQDHPGTDYTIGEIGKIIRHMKEVGCDAMCLAGLVRRPNLAKIKPDWRGVTLMPKLINAARRGDGALLDVLVETFREEGFTVVGADEIGAGLRVDAGALGAVTPKPNDLLDMMKAARVVDALAAYDIAQGAVVRNGFVLAIEAAEGTDQMLQRVIDLPAEVKGFEPNALEGAYGVLLKQPKLGQELRVDLPTIGTKTIELAADAGLAGVALAANAGLILDQEAVIRLADARGIFVYGFTPEDIAQPS